LFSARHIFLSIVLILTVVGCGPQYVGSDSHSSSGNEIGSIALMPPVFRVEKTGDISYEDTWEIAADFAAEITKVLTSLVTRSKYSLAPLDVSDAAIVADEQLRVSLANQEDGVNAIIDMLAGGGQLDPSVKYNADVSYLAKLSRARYLLFVQGAGYFESFPSQMKEEVFRDTGDSPGVGLVAFLVDTTNKQVVWHNVDFKTFQPPDDKEGLWPMGRAMFRSLLGIVDAPESSFWK
jgi:hypothetical protein